VYAFGTQFEGGFTFVQTSDGHVYTYASEAEARNCFGYVKTHAHLYQLNMDLSAATLVEDGDNLLPAPLEVEPTEEQKKTLYQSYPYKSLMAWVPVL
jgi:hypothetical protein